MLDSIREMGENLAGMGLALAGRALSGVFGVVRDVALRVEEHTGIPVPFAHSGMPVTMETADSPATWESGASSDGGMEKAPVAAVVAEPAEAEASSDPSVIEEKEPSGEQKAKAAAKQSPAKKTTRKKTQGKSSARKGKSRTSKKSGKKPAARNSQILRLLEILNRDPNSWMSAVELSAATDEQGSRILPGNVRKAIRLRGEGLIESRVRPGSKRGATEYRITVKGRAYLEENK